MKLRSKHFYILEDTLKIRKWFPNDMNNKKALNIAIEKWCMIFLHHLLGGYLTRGLGAYTCALCSLYVCGGCKNCPINIYTNSATACNNTPYISYFRSCTTNKEKIVSALQEILFLIKLRFLEEMK
jgi:hypothetical protein